MSLISIWLICGLVNNFYFIRSIIRIKKEFYFMTINYPMTIVTSIMAFAMGPVWTIGLIYYLAAVQHEKF